MAIRSMAGISTKPEITTAQRPMSTAVFPGMPAASIKSCHSGSRRPPMSTKAAATHATRNAKITTKMRPISAKISVRHRHGTQREPLARGKFFGRALELAAGGEDVAPARCAHRRGVAGAEHNLGELLDPLPLRAFVSAAGPWIERDQVDLRRNAGEQPHQRSRIGERVVHVLEHHVFEGDAPRVG